MLHPPPHTESNRWTVSLKSDSEILYVQRPTGDLIAAQIALARSTASSSYGAAGGLIIVLLWVYYSAQIFPFGAEFAKVYAHHHGSRA